MIVIKNNKKGISLTVLVISIVVITILSSAIIIQVSNSLSSARKTTFTESILLVEDQVKVYYSLNGNFPIMSGTGKMNINELLSYSNLSDEKKSILREELINYGDYTSENDIGEYYIIDLDKLDIENSKLGKVKDGKNDVFFVCYPTMNVYYLKGIEVEQKVFFSVSPEFERITNINIKKDTSVTTYKKVNGIIVKADNKIWSNRLGLKIEANLDTSEELYINISGVDDIKKVSTIVGQNRIVINNIQDIKEYTDITDAQISNFNNYSGNVPRKIEIIKKVNGIDVSKIIVDYSKYDYVSPVMASEITVKSDEDENTCIFDISDGNGSGIKTVKYEYLTVFDDKANIVSYYSNVEDYDISYLKSSGKEIKISSSGKAQIRVPKNVNSIQIYIEDNASNWTKTIQNVRTQIAVQIIPEKITKSELKFSIAINSLENILDLKSYISFDGTSYINENLHDMASKNNATFEVMYDNLEIKDIIYVKVVARSESGVIETVIKKLSTLDSIINKITKPILQEGMTPIKFTSSGKAVSTTVDDVEWYNYEENIWANAMTQDGSYWVWIPRYEYKITYYTDSTKTTKTENVTTYGDIDVKFISKNQVKVDEGYTYIHPAFRDGTATNFMNGEWDKEIPGFWVAKYAAGFQANTTDHADATSIINSTDNIIYSDKNYTMYNSKYITNAISQNLTELPKMSYPVFKPLTYAYNNIAIGDIYTISRQIANATNFYGLDGKKTDSHMMKNSEWGAVIYLAQSKYGRNGETIDGNGKYFNNLNSKHIYAITGYGNDTPNDIKASTTKNMSGIFDLNGCVWEYIAGYITSGDDNLKFGNSFVNTSLDIEGYKKLSTKYVTVYPFKEDGNDQTNYEYYNNLKSLTYGYGDGILETSIGGHGAQAWNNEHTDYLGLDNPFFIRGMSSEYVNIHKKEGIFSFSCDNFNITYQEGFRVVLIGL